MFLYFFLLIFHFVLLPIFSIYASEYNNSSSFLAGIAIGVSLAILANKIKKQKGFRPTLIHGVTGSGKTEIYLKLAEEYIKQKKSVLILVPEINLIPQLESRFKKRFKD